MSSSDAGSSSDEEEVGPTQVNANTPTPSVLGAPEQPSSSPPDSPPGHEEEGEGATLAQPTQAADAAQEDEGDPTQRMMAPSPRDLHVLVCAESSQTALFNGTLSLGTLSQAQQYSASLLAAVAKTPFVHACTYPLLLRSDLMWAVSAATTYH